MTARIISGNEISKQIREEIAREVEQLKAKTGKIPGLAVVLVGEDPASQVYVGMKEKACQKAGINSIERRLPAETKEVELLKLIQKLNADPEINGILVQLPLPDHIDETKVLNTIAVEKDVDGFHPANVGKLMSGEETFLPCTPHGIQELILRSGIPVEGQHVVVMGRSNIVGKPVAMILVQKKKGANATVTICHTRTKDMGYHTRQADILIVAAGKPKVVTAEMVKEGAVVIDVGVNEIGKTADGKRILCGDVDFESVKGKASAITPVPGGVGPMTIAMLMQNTVKAFRIQAGVK